MQCIYCSRILANVNGCSIHQLYCKENPNHKIKIKYWKSGFYEGFVPWNAGKTGLQTAWNKGIKGSTSGRASTPELEELRKARISKKAKLSTGGYRPGSGRGKKGWYKGIFCDSSWELAYVIYSLDHGTNIQKNNTKLPYVWNNKTRNYIPDFIVDGNFIEIKGYKSEQWEAKLAANPTVTVLYEKDLQPVFEYVINKYGKDFIKLYGSATVLESGTVLKTV